MKKWKIIISILVLIVAGGAGTLYYLLNVKEYKTSDPKVSAIVKSDYKIQLPGDTAGKGSPSEKQNGSGQGGQSGTSSKTQTGSSGAATADNANGNGSSKSSPSTASASTSPSSSSSSNPAVAVASQKASNASAVSTVQSEKLTASAIIGKYQPVFNDLESQANAKINSLLSAAMDEYRQKKASGQQISYFYFYSKYNSAAKQLEDGTDNTFNYIYNAMVKELVASGYSASDAQPIKDQYNSLKEQRRSSLLQKAVSHF